MSQRKHSRILKGIDILTKEATRLKCSNMHDLQGSTLKGKNSSLGSKSFRFREDPFCRRTRVIGKQKGRYKSCPSLIKKKSITTATNKQKMYLLCIFAFTMIERVDDRRLPSKRMKKPISYHIVHCISKGNFQVNRRWLA